MAAPELATGPLRRRVTDVPETDIAWFQKYCCQATRDSARELARAERTACRDGYILRWVRIWICQLLEPDGRTLTDESVGMHQN
jgi:hypothetical protein